LAPSECPRPSTGSASSDGASCRAASISLTSLRAAHQRSITSLAACQWSSPVSSPVHGVATMHTSASSDTPSRNAPYACRGALPTSAPPTKCTTPAHRAPGRGSSTSHPASRSHRLDESSSSSSCFSSLAHLAGSQSSEESACAGACGVGGERRAPRVGSCSRNVHAPAPAATHTGATQRRTGARTSRPAVRSVSVANTTASSSVATQRDMRVGSQTGGHPTASWWG
jgi:hypothetical protein